MNFSPIVIQRKFTAPVAGSTNPFDDFDFLELPGQTQEQRLQQQPQSCSLASSSLTSSQKPQRYESFDSDDDPFNLFSDDGSVGSKASPIMKHKLAKKPSSGLRNESRTASEDDAVIEKDEDDEQESISSEDSAAKPAVPPRTQLSAHWIQRLAEPVIPFDADDAKLYAFITTPLEEGQSLLMTISQDPFGKSFQLIQDSSSRIILTATKRLDGLKAFSLATNYSIMMLPTDRSVARSQADPPKSRAASLLEPVRVGKLRSNALGSQYSLFDQGKNPEKATGMNEVRRELMAIKFEVVHSVYTRRSTFCCLPKTGHFRRPTSKDQILLERAKNQDPHVVTLFPFIPNTSRLPRQEDFQGFAPTHSVKNIMLHDPSTKRIVLRFAKQNDRITFKIQISHPFSILSAFGLAIASIDSRVHPNRQL